MPGQDPPSSNRDIEAEKVPVVPVAKGAPSTTKGTASGAKDVPPHEELMDSEFGEIVPVGCGPLGQYPVLTVLLFALVGIAIGVGLAEWEPAEADDKKYTLQWLGLIGDLYIRCLKAIVLPLVFINVVIAVVEMMGLGRASSIGWLTIGMYLLTTVIAAVIGCISIAIFKGLFEQRIFDESGPDEVMLGCNRDGFFIAEDPSSGALSCSNTADEASMTFTIDDVSGSFVKSSSGPKNSISLSDTFYDGVFIKLITSNIFQSFVSANFAAVVVFAIAFGFALGRVLFKKVGGDLSKSAVINFFKELDGVFLTLINWVILTTPFAVMSLIIKAVGKQSDLKGAFENVGYLVVATILAMAAHFLVAHVTLLAVIRKHNPIDYLKHIVPAQTMAFACASSAATIPVTLRCVHSSGMVPEPVLRFVIPLGATINMDGGAIYFPCACIWLAVLNGITPDPSSYILLIIIATIGSAGTAPVPSASLVLIITAYNTVFNATGTPDGFEFILAIDWFMDRLRTTLNVTGDTVVCGLVAALSHYEEAEEELNDSEEEEAEG